MDLSKLDDISTATHDLPIYGPDGEELTYTTDDGTVRTCTIRILSADSAEYARVFKRQVTEKTKQMQRRGKPRVSGETIEREQIELLVACTRGWEGFQMAGEPYLFSPENARQLYTAYPIIREQVEAGIRDRGNFVRS